MKKFSKAKKHYKKAERKIMNRAERRRRELSCDDCRKCGETICGNDTENMRCFESK